MARLTRVQLGPGIMRRRVEGPAGMHGAVGAEKSGGIPVIRRARYKPSGGIKDSIRHLVTKAVDSVDDACLGIRLRQALRHRRVTLARTNQNSTRAASVTAPRVPVATDNIGMIGAWPHLGRHGVTE
jgi:hypothetical protein